MPHVTVGAAVAAPPQVLRALVAEPQRWARRAPHVLAVAPGTPGTTAWQVLLNGSRCAWTLAEQDDPAGARVFHQVGGDLEAMSGRWSFEPDGAGTYVRLEVTFDLGVDGLAGLLDPIWSQSLRAHGEALVHALAATCDDDLPRP